MQGIPKFLKEHVPGIEDIQDKAIKRERSICPKCESVIIVYRSRTHEYVCERCFYRFKHPKKKMMFHDDGFCCNPSMYKGNVDVDVDVVEPEQRRTGYV